MEGRRKFSVTPEISEVHTKQFLCLFFYACHHHLSNASLHHVDGKETTEMIPVGPQGWIFQEGSLHAAAALCGTFWALTPRWLCGHTPPAPGRTKLSAPFQRCSLSRINCSSSEILTEASLTGRVADLLSLSVLVPLLCLCHVTSHSSSLLLSTDLIFTAIFWKLQKSNTHWAEEAEAKPLSESPAEEMAQPWPCLRQEDGPDSHLSFHKT